MLPDCSPGLSHFFLGYAEMSLSLRTDTGHEFEQGPDAGFSQIDFAQMYLDNENRHAKHMEDQKAKDKELIDSGAVSALDLDAPNGAIVEFNRARTLLKAQNSKEAMKHLQKAIAEYPKFVSAHIGLGLAYADQEDPGRARSEFEAAAKLDDKFPGSFLHLGRLALSQNDFRDCGIGAGKSCCPAAQGRRLSSRFWRMRKMEPMNTGRF